MSDYPSFVCCECGMRYGRRKPIGATWHSGKCDICGQRKPVTQPRDFGHLKLDEEEAERESP